jgi:type 1 glutamine amidotransferase
MSGTGTNGANGAGGASGAGKQALMVWGGWDGHAPEQTTALFADFLRRQGFAVTVSASLDSYADAALMGRMDLIVNTVTCGTMNGEQTKGLVKAVRAGAGLAGWHGGICDAFRGNIDYQHMTGGQFLCHPGGNIDYDVAVSAWDDPIMAGIAPFRMTATEQYYMLMDPAVRVLATTTFRAGHAGDDEGTVMPVAWKRRWGQGRVFVSALGHAVRDFDVPEARLIMERGLLWASR